MRSDLGPKACLPQVAQAGTPARVSRRESGLDTVSSKERSQAPTRLRESSAAADSCFFAINHKKKTKKISNDTDMPAFDFFFKEEGGG